MSKREAICFLILGLGLAITVQVLADEENLLQQGVKFLNQRKFKQAEKALLALITSEPRNKWAHFYLGELYYQQGRWKEAGEEFHRAAKIDHKFKEAWNGYGKALLRQEWLSDNNLRARWQFEKALKIDRDYLEARVNLAKAYAGARMKESAIRELKKVIRKGDSTAQVYYLMGRFYEARVPYGQRKELQKAIQAYKKSLRLNPRRVEAWLRLGINYYRLRRLLKAENCFREALKLNKDFITPYLMLGLVCYDRGDWEEAQEHFLKAISLMDERERRFYITPELILSKEERRVVKELPPEQRRGLFRDYWRQRDPDPTTPLNERLIEHYARVAYSRLFFSEEKYPWDERGEPYIRYGRPDLRFCWGIFQPTETWVYNYPPLTFVFRAFGLYPNYRVPIDEVGNQVMFAYEAEKRSNPEVYNFPYKGEPLRYIFDIVCFKDRIEICYGIPITELYFDQIDGREIASVEVRAVLFDSLGREVKTYTGRKDYPLQPYSTSFSKMIFDAQGLKVAPGRYRLALSIEDLSTGNREIYTREIELNGKLGLRLSDMFWSDKLNSLEGRILKNGLRLSPYPIKIYSPGQLLHTYFEVYGLDKDPLGRTHYRLDYSLSPHRVKRSFLGSLFSLAKKVIPIGKEKLPVVSNTFEYYGETSEDFQYISLDVRAYPPGFYDLKIKVIDLNNGQSDSKTSTFQIAKEFPRLISEKALDELGFGYLKEGKVAQAKRNLGEDFRIYTSEGNIFFAIGTAYHLKGAYRQAEVKYLEALKSLRKEEKPDVLSNLGALYFRRGEFQKAEKALKEALTINRDHKTTIFNLALLHMARGEYDYAIDYLEKLRRLSQDDERIYFRLGQAVFERDRRGHRYQKAIKLFKEALRINPHYAEAYQWLGMALWEEGDVDKAERALREAIQLKPRLALAHLYLGLILQSKGEYDKAEEQIEQALALDRRLVEAYLNLAQGKGLP